MKRHQLMFAAALVGVAVVVISGLGPTSACIAQSLDEQIEQGQVTTLHAATHLTIEDVVVTDASGKPVLGLPQSAFHVIDDGAAQTIRNFDESSVSNAATSAPTPHGVFSNATLTNPDASVNVLLLDPIGIEIADQMFLRLQALRYLQSMPEGTTIAVFRTSRDGRPLLVQSMTQDRGLLIKAINTSIPTFAVTVPLEEVYYNALAELSNIAEYLSQAQGRKSLIWFTGKFPLSQVLGGNGAQQSADFSVMEEARKSVDRKLEAARIAVFPIDVRGMVAASLNVNLQANTTGQSSGPNQVAGGAAEMGGSWGAMDDLAATTGGVAFHGNNRLTELIQSAVDLGRHFYTLSYSAQPYEENGKWHKVTIKVDGGYKASYRQGYYAHSSAAVEQRVVSAMQAHAGTLVVKDSASVVPIIFQARVLADHDHPGSGLIIQYAVAAKDLHFKLVDDDKQQAHLQVAVLGYDMSGMILNHAVDDVKTRFDLAQMADARKVGVPVLQELKVSRGAKFLLLSVVDLDTGRTGTIQMTVDSAKQAAK